LIHDHGPRGVVPGIVSEGLNGWSEALRVGLVELTTGWTAKPAAKA